MSDIDDLDAAISAIPDSDIDTGLIVVSAGLLQLAGKVQMLAITVRTGDMAEALRSLERTRDELSAARDKMTEGVEVLTGIVEKIKRVTATLEEDGE